MEILSPTLEKNDKKAYWLIGIFSVVVFVAVSLLSKFKLTVNTGFDVHVFALVNAFINSAVAILLVLALFAVKKKRYQLHRNFVIAALVLSILFLVSYIAHHLLAGEARFGDINHDGELSADEKEAVGITRYIYYVLLSTHILLASIILPFILFTAYRGLTGEWQKHRKIAKYTWPLWLYVAITGPVVYLMIRTYYS